MTPPTIPAEPRVPQVDAAQELAADRSWCRDVLYKIHLDLHCPDWDPEILSRLDPAQIVSTVARSGAPMLYFFAKDCYGNAYYDTKVGHRHACIGNRDFLREIIAEGQRQGVRIVAYYSVIWDNRMANLHPEWRMRYRDGKQASDTVTTDGASRWQYLCHNTDYLGYVTDMLEEIASEYPVAGFHLDMLNMDFGKPSCYCDNCRRLFREQTGLELPDGSQWDAHWRRFLEFRYDSVERFALGMREAIHRHRPGLPVIMNYHSAPNFDWRTGQLPVRHALYSDLGTGETYTPLFGDMYPGLDSRYVRALVPGKPFEIVSWRMNRVTDFTLKPREQMRWELLTSVAHGGSVMVIDQPFHDGWLDEEPYRQLGEIFSEIEAKRPYLKGEAVKHVGIYISARNRDQYGRNAQVRYLAPMQGAYKALIENHFNVSFLFDETLELESLLEYPVVVLPNVAAMTDAEAELFTAYVREGGTLISTFSTSLHDDFGEPRANFALREVFGLDYSSTVDCDTHFLRALEGPLGEHVNPAYYVLGVGAVHLVEPHSAQPCGDVHESFRKRIIPEQFFSHNIHPPYQRVGAAAYVNAYGKGRSIYFPHGLDADYANNYELPEHRIMLGNAVRLAGHVSPIEVLAAPLNVEINVNEHEDGWFVHALAFNPSRQAVTLTSLNESIRPSGRMDAPMMYEAKVRINAPFQTARLLNGDGRLTRDGNTISWISEDVHEILVITR